MLAGGALEPDGALAGIPDDADDGLDAAAGLDADEAPDAPEVGAAPVCEVVSELELPPLHPPMIAAIAPANTPTVKCPFIFGSPFWRGPSPVLCDYRLRRLNSGIKSSGRASDCRNRQVRLCMRTKIGCFGIAGKNRTIGQYIQGRSDFGLSGTLFVLVTKSLSRIVNALRTKYRLIKKTVRLKRLPKKRNKT
ncbi:hypothetical protein AWB75_01035 [Caballeronia catudaia]|uniref:Uncharacterized protein n=1 Tax=Caballeronia catudaia TaxID=1777136 RepID=A0A157ZQG3_9BURK|nr:hypothetical protein AWB75_01035 [Caballeronia catudaia]